MESNMFKGLEKGLVKSRTMNQARNKVFWSSLKMLWTIEITTCKGTDGTRIQWWLATGEIVTEDSETEGLRDKDIF